MRGEFGGVLYRWVEVGLNVGGGGGGGGSGSGSTAREIIP